LKEHPVDPRDLINAIRIYLLALIDICEVA
jgi:hypothetical protein